MRKIKIFIFSLLFSHFLFQFSALPVRAFEVTSDPQYIIMNFATINELNWSAPETDWQSTIKPQVITQIKEMYTALMGTRNQQPETGNRLLGWSTLMEYMNFPMDTAGPNSPYAIKMRRILEITDELNLPIFVPLNGFQWWDQLPELYNWWDSDGTHTDPAFFARQKNPTEFKQRFIAGYNHDNIWNVEWQDPQTPMKLNYRNWGGGGFRLAPPPNLDSAAYRSILTARLKAILSQLIPYLNKWEKEGRNNLFAGLSIGTEISLNASVTPQDEFLPYGWRAIQDRLCPASQQICATTQKFSSLQIDTARRQTVNYFLVDLSRTISNLGIPKQRIYTHVWSEAKDGEPRHVNYADAAYTLYSRPGMSFYGYAQDPLSLPDWKNALMTHGYPSWGAIEYSAGNSSTAWDKGLKNIFENRLNSGKIQVIYNWQEQEHTGAVPALRSFLAAVPEQQDCPTGEIIPVTENSSINPNTLDWKYLGTPPSGVLALHIKKGIRTNFDSPNQETFTLPAGTTRTTTPQLPPGTYSWYLDTAVCDAKIVTSEPRSLIVTPVLETHTPAWVNWILDLQQKLALR